MLINIILEEENCRIVSMDSVAYMNDSCRGDIVICGSHGGQSAASYLSRFKPRGAIFNDAGRGINNAGIDGLELFDKLHIPAAAVDAFSARIGKGTETYEDGIISIVNKTAQSYGIKSGMMANDAAKLLFSAVKDKPIAKKIVQARRPVERRMSPDRRKSQ